MIYDATPAKGQSTIENDVLTLRAVNTETAEVVEIARHKFPLNGELYYTLDAKPVLHCFAAKRTDHGIRYESITLEKAGKIVYMTGFCDLDKVAAAECKLWPVTRQEYIRQIAVFFKGLHSPFALLNEILTTKTF